VLKQNFHRSRGEEGHFKAVFRERLSIADSLDGYMLFRSEIALEPMCSDLPCQVEILFNEKADVLFVGIHKL